MPADVDGCSMMTVLEVAENLGVARNTVYELVKQRVIPHKKLGRIIRIPTEAYRKWRETSDGGAWDDC